MGRAPCCDKANVKRGPWSPEEDTTLKNYLAKHGTGCNWIALPRKEGLRRCGKSCRLRWLNYLRPDIKHGGFTEEEDNIIWTVYKNIGSKWSLIASHLPGRTDNEVKNHWNTKLKKKLLAVNVTSDAGNGDNNHIQRCRFPSFVSAVSTEDYSCSYSTPVNGSATQVPTMDVGFECDVDPQGLSSELIQFPLPVSVAMSESRRSASSSLSVENNSMPWAVHGGTECGSLSMDFGHASSSDFQEKRTKVTPNLSNFYANLLSNCEIKALDVSKCDVLTQ